MIVLEDRKLVILTPPHTASGNLHRALCSSQFGGMWAIGPTPDGSGYDHHVTRIAEGWRDFKVALVVRHPLDRLIGLYEHHQEATRLGGWQPIEWWMFVAMALEQHRDLSWFYRTTINDLIGTTNVDHVLRYESLDVDLIKLLGEPVPLSPGWVDARNWSAFHAQIGVCCMAEWWGRNDMERFHYVSQLTQPTIPRDI